MNRMSKLAIAVFLSASAFSGISHAATMNMGMNWPRDVDGTLKTFHGKFDVVMMVSLDGGAAMPETKPQSYINAMQAAIESNKSLVKRLKDRNIAVHAIVNAEEAADGSITFYIN